MKTVNLSGVNVKEFKEFIGMLAKLSQATTVYFTIDNDKIVSDSYIESKSLIKSLRYDLVDFFDESSIEGVVKCTFYSGKKLKDALDYFQGSATDITIECNEYDGETFASKFTISDGKLSITLKGSDPALIEFVSVPSDAIKQLTSCDSAENAFQITAADMKRVKSLEGLDSNPYLNFAINGSVKVISDNSFDIDLNDNMDQISKKGDYKVDKSLLSLVEDETYSVYAFPEKLILKSVDEKITNVVALTDTVG